MRLEAWALLLGVALSGCGGGGSGGGGPGNAAPVFTSPAAASIAENATAAAYVASAVDVDGQALTFTIAGGADAARFRLEGASLRFLAPPDFEAPGDADRDNIYEITLAVGDGQAVTTQSVRLTVTDVAGQAAFRRVATGFAAPVFVTGLGDGSGRILVVEKGGLVRIVTVAGGAAAAEPFLDVTASISTDGERGLLGLALAPDFATSRLFYVYLTNPGGDIEIRRYRTIGATDRADPATADVILTIEHSAFSNHNGGWLGFGPDGLLHAGVGDGGGGGDPLRSGQDRTTLLGKIVRIDPRSVAFPADPSRDYAIPAGNIFAAGGAAPEIFALGLRNPFRAAFDRETGDLYIGDVGQNAREEIDLVRRTGDAGLNFGWSVLEGTAPFSGGAVAGLTSPIAEYPHSTPPAGGGSVTGGVVYRGPVASLRGQYFFADFVKQKLWTLPVARVAQGSTLQIDAFTDRTATILPDQGALSNVTSFGEDELGNLFVTDIDGEVFALVELD